MPETEFQKSCNLFEERLINAMKILSTDKQWFALAILCCIAIDVFADAEYSNEYVGKAEYIKFLKKKFSDSYGQDSIATKFYQAIRSGLIHRLQLIARKDDGFRSDFENGTPEAAIGQKKGDEAGPYISNDTLVIHVPHLHDEVLRYYTSFKKTPYGPSQSRFTQRMRQMQFQDDGTGLVPVSEESSNLFTATDCVSATFFFDQSFDFHQQTES